MKCPRDEWVDCYFVKTQEEAEKCLWPNQYGASQSCQAQGDKPTNPKLGPVLKDKP